jgi:biopolymer transport protein ExbB/TolQ
MNTVAWIVVAVVIALLLIAAVVLVAQRGRAKRRRTEAAHIREQAREDAEKVERREALAEETAAQARAARAEADAKAAEAARLESRAAAHQSVIAASHEDVNKRLEHADRLDPDTRKADKTANQHDAADKRGDETVQTSPPDQTQQR